MAVQLQGWADTLAFCSHWFCRVNAGSGLGQLIAVHGSCQHDFCSMCKDPLLISWAFICFFSYKNLRNSLRIKHNHFCSSQWFSTTLYRLQMKRSSSLGEISGQIKMISLEHLCLQDLVVGPPGLSAPLHMKKWCLIPFPLAMQVVLILPPGVSVA